MSHISRRDPLQVDKRTIATGRGRGVDGSPPPRTFPQGPVRTIPPGSPPSPLCDTRALAEEFPTPRARAALCDSPRRPAVMYSPLTRDTPLIRDTPLSHRGAVPPHAFIPPLHDPAPTEGDPTETFIFSRRCSFPLGRIYFFVDRRGSPSPGLSETITSHSEPRFPSYQRAESKGTDPLGAPG